MIIGASNCRNVQVEVPYKVEMHTQGGASISDVGSMLEDVEAPAGDVAAVLIHIGTCDFDSRELNHPEFIYAEFVETINNVSSTYPEADIILSSVLPRAPRAGYENKRINEEVLTLNQLICQLAQMEQRVMGHINNDNGFVTEDGVISELYRHTDRTGVHLNEKGTHILSDKFKESLIEAFYKNKLQHEFDVIP